MSGRHQQTLSAFNSWEKRQFEYGVADCCQFTSHVVNEIHGVNHMDKFNYSSESEAYEIINEYGDLGKAVESQLGEPTSIDNIQDGDPILFDAPLMDSALGVKLGKHIIALSHQRIIRISTKYAVHGWAL